MTRKTKILGSVLGLFLITLFFFDTDMEKTDAPV